MRSRTISGVKDRGYAYELSDRLPAPRFAGLVAIAWTVVLFGVSAPAVADTTTVIDFDPPAFAAGQVVSAAPGVAFPDNPVVFTPSSVATQTGPNAHSGALD